MNYTSILFGFVCATLLGAAFHLWRGGKLGKLLLHLVASWSGFIGGHWAASSLNWNFDLLGQIHLLFGCLGSLVFIIVGNFLSFQDKHD